MSKNKPCFLVRKEYSREKSGNDTILVELKVYFAGLPVYYVKKSVPASPLPVREDGVSRTKKRIPTVKVENF